MLGLWLVACLRCRQLRRNSLFVLSACSVCLHHTQNKPRVWNVTWSTTHVSATTARHYMSCALLLLSPNILLKQGSSSPWSKVVIFVCVCATFRTRYSLGSFECFSSRQFLPLFCFLIKQLLASSSRDLSSESRLRPGLLKRLVYIQAASSPLFLTGKSPDKHVYLCLISFLFSSWAADSHVPTGENPPLFSNLPETCTPTHRAFTPAFQSFCWEWKPLCCVPYSEHHVHASYSYSMCSLNTTPGEMLMVASRALVHNLTLCHCGCSTFAETGCCFRSPLKPHPVCWKLLKPARHSVCRLSRIKLPGTGFLGQPASLSRFRFAGAWSSSCCKHNQSDRKSEHSLWHLCQIKVDVDSSVKAHLWFKHAEAFKCSLMT